MIRKIKKILIFLFCLTCLSTPLNVSAELSVDEYDVTFDGIGGQKKYHRVKLESDLFSYSISGCYKDGPASKLIYDSAGTLSTDIVDVNYIVTCVLYDEDKPWMLILDSIAPMGTKNYSMNITELVPYLEGELPKVGDLLYLENYNIQELYLNNIVGPYEDGYLSEPQPEPVARNLGSGVDIFGKDFKKVLYYELYESPLIMLSKGIFPVEQSDYSYDYYCYGKGMVDSNDTIDLLDVIAVNRYLMLGEPIGYYGALCADVNNDGQVTSADALHILRKVVGLIDSFEEVQ